MYFTFNQNNSGGDLDILEEVGIGINVIIEAKDAKQANAFALL